MLSLTVSGVNSNSVREPVMVCLRRVNIAIKQTNYAFRSWDLPLL